MSDDLNTFLVEFRSTMDKKDDPDSPVQELERYLQKQNRAFAVEEYILKKKKLSHGDDWSQWFLENPNEKEAFVAVFLVEKKDKAYFDDLLDRHFDEKSKRG